MYVTALVASITAGLPFFHLGSIDIGLPFSPEWFGVIVAIGVLIGAAILRRYAEWHGVFDEHIRGLTGWITVAGFLGAHFLVVIFEHWDRLERDPVVFIQLW